MKYYPGVKKVNISAAKKYAVRPDYIRPEQKNHMIYQGDWNEDLQDLSTQNFKQSRIERINNEEPGYSMLDWAFLQGAQANMNASDFFITIPNKKGTSWTGDEKKAWFADTEAPRLGPSCLEPATNSGIIKKMATFFGADQVGICLLDRRWVYSTYYDPVSKCSYPIKFSDEAGYEEYSMPTQLEGGTQVIPKEMKYVIVFIHGMDYLGIQTAPSLTQMAATMTTYSQIALTSISMAAFIRGLGYKAIPSANCTALNIPLAIDAGLGELGRNGKLINPILGPRCRISKVFTDLPLVIDTPIDFGVSRICGACRKCAEACRVRAIPFGERSYEPVGIYSQQAVLQWQLDHSKCRRYWTTIGTNCGICIRVCPYNQKANLASSVVKSLTALTPFSNRLLLKLDSVLKGGAFMPSDQFWNSA